MRDEKHQKPTHMKCSNKMGKGYESSHISHCTELVEKGVVPVHVVEVQGETETWAVV